MIDVDDLVDRLELEEYGIGIPFAFVTVGLALLYGAFPGIASFGDLTGYGRFGLSIMIVVCVASLVAAGYTYNEIDRGWWVLLKDRDGPAAEADDDPLDPDGTEPSPEVDAE